MKPSRWEYGIVITLVAVCVLLGLLLAVRGRRSNASSGGRPPSRLTSTAVPAQHQPAATALTVATFAVPVLPSLYRSGSPSTYSGGSSAGYSVQSPPPIVPTPLPSNPTLRVRSLAPSTGG